MKLDTQDIVLQEFKKVLRGYDPVEVKAFLEVIAEKYRQAVNDQQKLHRVINDLKQSNAALNEQLAASEKEIAQLRTDVKKIDRLVDARIDGDLIMQQARQDADNLIQEAENTILKYREEIRYLDEQRKRSAAILKEYLLKQLAVLNLMTETVPDTPVNEIQDELTRHTASATEHSEPVLNASPAITSTDQNGETIGSFLDQSSFDELPKEMEEALLDQSDGQEIKKPSTAITDDRRRQMVKELDQLNEQATAMFRKADFEKMLGDTSLKKSEELINQIYSELEKKKNKNSSSTETP